MSFSPPELHYPLKQRIMKVCRFIKKRLLLAFLTALSFTAIAQDENELKQFRKEMEQIRQAEMRMKDRLETAGIASDYTVASTNFDLNYCRMEWAINPEVLYINGKITYYFTMTSPGSSITMDLAKQLTVDSILYHGNAISLEQTPENGLVIQFPTSLAKAVQDSFTIYYQGVPAPGQQAFYKTTQSAVPVIYTLSEPYGARDWWPCNNGLSDKIDSLDILITCPQQYQPSSNGLMISNTVNGAFRTSQFKHRYPIAPYLVALAATNYVINNDTIQVGNGVYALQSFAYPSGAANFFTREKNFIKGVYRTFSTLFGLYPFAGEKYGHTQWGWNGGMEHQTNSFVNAAANALMAHELAHQWFGDYITCKSWQHIWLNEGFATYLNMLSAEYGFPEYFRPRLEATYEDILSDSAGSVFVTDTSSVARIFDQRLTYNKGAYVLHMLRWTLGDSAFYRGVRRYLNDPKLRLGYAVTEDLRRNMEEESGRNLETFFQKWVYSEGYANYHADWSQNKNHFVTVKLSQTTSHPSVSFYEMPVTLLLRSASQGKSFVVNHQFSGQEFVLDAGFPVDTVIIDPDIWILAKLKTSTKIGGTNTIGNEVRLYPNPAPQQLTVSLKNPTGRFYRVILYNQLGQLIYSSERESPGQDILFTIPLQHLPRGRYVLQLSNEADFKYTRSIIH